MAEAIVKNKRLTFGLHMKNKDSLYKAYMPFIEGGGLFIPTVKIFSLGQSIGLKLKLLDESNEYKVNCKVVWVTPETSHGRWKPGVGIQFLDAIGEQLHDKIEKILADSLDSGKLTNTL